MRIVSGSVVPDRIVVDGEPLAEGTAVTILSADESVFEVDPEQERRLVVALAEAGREEGIEGGALLDELDG